MAAWPDDTLNLGTSDDVLCAQTLIIEDVLARRTAALWQKPYADVQRNGSSLGPRCAPAPCGPKPQRPSDRTMETLVPNGFLLDVCPEDSYANQLTFDGARACTRSHQTFLNTTKRGTGALPGSNRGMTR